MTFIAFHSEFFVADLFSVRKWTEEPRAEVNLIFQLKLNYKFPLSCEWLMQKEEEEGRRSVFTDSTENFCLLFHLNPFGARLEITLPPGEWICEGK